MSETRRKPVANKTHGFTENDVKVCESLEQLRDWHNKVSLDIQTMEGKLENIKNKKETGQEVDTRWEHSLEYAKGLQEKFLKVIESKAAELRNDENNPFFVESKMEEELAKRYPEIHREILTIARMGDGTE